MPQLDDFSGYTMLACPLLGASVTYQPTLFGNAFFLAIYGSLLLIQVFQAYHYKTWSFSIAMMSGCALEVVGYVGRIQMHFNPFLADPSYSPVFFAAAIYLTLSRVIVHYRPIQSRFSPKTISLTFMSCDFLALVFQGTGGGLADTAADVEGRDRGTNIMVGGLAFQVITLLGFMVVAGEYALKFYRGTRTTRAYLSRCKLCKANAGKQKREKTFRAFLFALTGAAIFILTRSAFRVAELAKGFTSKLANEEIPFMVLEGGMIILATTLLTVFHPGREFGDKWVDAGWTGKKRVTRTKSVDEGRENDQNTWDPRPS